MKKLFTVALTAVSLSAFAQTTVTDSIKTGAGYANDVYYSLANGEVKSQVNNDWHLALSIGSFNVAARINSGTGSSGIGEVRLYEVPGKDTNKWATLLDTAGLSGWGILLNSQSDWEEGAFNVNAAGMDYGWGVYSGSPLHIVVGDRLYIASIKTGASTIEYKKLWLVKKDKGVWTVRYANIDGTNETTVDIKSSDYAGKNFAYLSLTTGAVIDREPASADWDFVLTRYAYEAAPGYIMSATGILTNYGVTTGEVRKVATSTSKLADTASMSSDISEIGADWKSYNMATFSYVMVDSLTYFIQDQEGDYWKLVFTAFRGADGHTAFTKTKVNPPTSINAPESTIEKMALYPNPAVSEINVLYNLKSEGTVNIRVQSLNGQEILTKSVNASNGMNVENLNVSNLTNGFYVITVENNGFTTVQKFVKR